MNEINTIAIINPSNSDGTGTKTQLLKNYINLVNRVHSRITQEQDNVKTFDSPSTSGVP